MSGSVVPVGPRLGDYALERVYVCPPMVGMRRGCGGEDIDMM